MKIKSGTKYKILCDYKNPVDNEYLKAGDILEVDHITCWGSYDVAIRYGLVHFKNSFPLFSHIFEMIAEEVSG